MSNPTIKGTKDRMADLHSVLYLLRVFQADVDDTSKLLDLLLPLNELHHILIAYRQQNHVSDKIFIKMVSEFAELFLKFYRERNIPCWNLLNDFLISIFESEGLL